MAMLTREAFLSARLRHEVVSCPGLGEVWLWEMNGLQRSEFEQSFRDDAPLTNIERAALAVRLCAGNEAGLFNPQPTVAELMEKIPAVVLDQLAMKALTLNVMTREAAEAVQGE